MQINRRIHNGQTIEKAHKRDDGHRHTLKHFNQTMKTCEKKISN